MTGAAGAGSGICATRMTFVMPSRCTFSQVSVQKGHTFTFLEGPAVETEELFCENLSNYCAQTLCATLRAGQTKGNSGRHCSTWCCSPAPRQHGMPFRRSRTRPDKTRPLSARASHSDKSPSQSLCMFVEILGPSDPRRRSSCALACCLSIRPEAVGAVRSNRLGYLGLGLRASFL